MSGFTLIDPPACPYSSIEELQAWLDQLTTLEPTEEVREAIVQAERWLESALAQARLNE